MPDQNIPEPTVRAPSARASQLHIIEGGRRELEKTLVAELFRATGDASPRVESLCRQLARSEKRPTLTLITSG